MPISHRTWRNLRPASPRTTVIAVAAIAMVLVQLLAVVASGNVARDAMVESASRALEIEGDVTIERITRFLEPAGRVVDDTVQLLDDEVVSISDGELETYLLTRLASLEHVSAVHVGFPDGSFVVVTTDAGDAAFESRWIRGDGSARIVTRTSYDEAFTPIGRRTSSDVDYDPRVRPWYLAAIAVPGIVWTEPYGFATSRHAGFTASRAHRDDAVVRAVVGVDVRLADLAALVAEFDEATDHETFVLSGDSVLVAPADVADTPDVADDGSLELPTLVSVGMDGHDAAPGVATLVETPTGQDLVLVLDVPGQPGRDWHLHLRADAASATAIAARQQSTMVRVMLGGSLVVLVAFGVLLRVSRPISVLAGQATTDPLTGLANRRRIDAQGARMADAVRGEGGFLSVLTIDLDGFKDLNDRHGHHVGDDALRIVGRELTRLTRRHDLVGRLGGDEFVVVQRVDHGRDGIETARRIVDRLAAQLRHALPQCAIGVSGGLAVGDRTTTSFGDLVREADASLLAAKGECRGMMRVADRTVAALV